MKFSKPVYDSSTKSYRCEVTESDSFRFESAKEDTTFTPSLDTFVEVYRIPLTNDLLQATKGWFTKPLTYEWLLPRIEFNIPTDEVPPMFEGTIEWQLVSIIITKDRFMCMCKMTSMREADKITIEFEEEERLEGRGGEGSERIEVVDIPCVNDSEAPVDIGPTRRVLQKQLVLQARSKAARALFKAEHMTQKYIEMYGEDTDWEDEEDEDSV
jgi:hypothetical protein